MGTQGADGAKQRRNNAKGFGLGLGILAVAALMLFAPAAQAATVSFGPAILTAPYPGTLVSPSSSVSSSGCGHAVLLHGAFFHGTTGRGGLAIAAHSRICAGPFSDYGLSEAAFGALVPVSLNASESVLKAEWTFKGTMSANVGGTNCVLLNLTFSQCYVSASSYLSAYLYLEDATSGSYLYSSNFFTGPSLVAGVSDYCYDGSCASNVTPSAHQAVQTSFIWVFHSHAFGAQGFNASHTYYLVTEVYAEAYVSDSTYDAILTGGPLGASTLFNGPGAGITLNWISIH